MKAIFVWTIFGNFQKQVLIFTQLIPYNAATCKKQAKKAQKVSGRHPKYGNMVAIIVPTVSIQTGSNELGISYFFRRALDTPQERHSI